MKLSISLLLLATLVLGNSYPPDYITNTNCHGGIPVQVCQINTMSGYSLKVIYSGYLIHESSPHIGFYIKFNGKEAMIVMPISSQHENSTIQIGLSARNCVYCNYPNLNDADKKKCQDVHLPILGVVITHPIWKKICSH